MHWGLALDLGPSEDLRSSGASQALGQPQTCLALLCPLPMAQAIQTWPVEQRLPEKVAGFSMPLHRGPSLVSSGQPSAPSGLSECSPSLLSVEALWTLMSSV